MDKSPPLLGQLLTGHLDLRDLLIAGAVEVWGLREDGCASIHPSPDFRGRVREARHKLKEITATIAEVEAWPATEAQLHHKAHCNAVTEDLDDAKRYRADLRRLRAELRDFVAALQPERVEGHAQVLAAADKARPTRRGRSYTHFDSTSTGTATYPPQPTSSAWATPPRRFA